MQLIFWRSCDGRQFERDFRRGREFWVDFWRWWIFLDLESSGDEELGSLYRVCDVIEALYYDGRDAASSLDLFTSPIYWQSRDGIQLSYDFLNNSSSKKKSDYLTNPPSLKPRRHTLRYPDIPRCLILNCYWSSLEVPPAESVTSETEIRVNASFAELITRMKEDFLEELDRRLEEKLEENVNRRLNEI